ncbi:Dual specificity protein phosphatase 7 [Phytophthora nicotianae]|uniref:Dual specificity protein phosphatase 7 n=1 Tax=Phytophthora nicotianae TaxID=4792 RepID=A0A0W8CEC1_PHYNI|nr:Dual specificity protein phosphatase 7 [Phytophthora nicotianae]
MRQKRVFTEKQRLGVEDGPSKILGAAGIKRRTRHCMIRLLNVMFSETFAGRVHEIDGKPTRAELDSNQTHASSSFWTYIHDAYLSDQAEFGKLNSTLAMFAKCNPAIIVPHDAAKLRDMWKDLVSTLSSLLSLRERSMNVPNGSYTKFDLQEANVDIEHVRGKKKALLKDQSAA